MYRAEAMVSNIFLGTVAAIPVSASWWSQSRRRREDRAVAARGPIAGWVRGGQGEMAAAMLQLAVFIRE